MVYIYKKLYIYIGINKKLFYIFFNFIFFNCFLLESYVSGEF